MDKSGGEGDETDRLDTQQCKPMCCLRTLISLTVSDDDIPALVPPQPRGRGPNNSQGSTGLQRRGKLGATAVRHTTLTAARYVDGDPLY